MEYTTIGVSPKLHDEIEKLGAKGETFEQILWRLIKDRSVAAA